VIIPAEGNQLTSTSSAHALASLLQNGCRVIELDAPWDDEKLGSIVMYPQSWKVSPLINSHITGKSPFLMGKSTISMAMFNSKLLNYQRV
jgi:hypothetical protein